MRPEGTVERPPRSGLRLALLCALGAALLVAAGVAAGLVLARREPPGRAAKRSEIRHFIPQGSGPPAAPFASGRPAASYATAYVRGGTLLYDAPGGRPKVRLTRRTEWGSPRFLGVVGQRGPWLAVQVPELRNHELAWLPLAKATLGGVRYSLHTDLSRRLLTVRDGKRTIRRLTIAIGRPSNPTPLGRFSVTDKLLVTKKSSPYGCCVLALTGHQTRLPPDWPGGDRLAIHATSATWSIGHAVSFGCMRADAAQVRWLVKSIPLGTPVFIRR
jgi:L,D-transpeptidase catalytic domain